MRKRCESFQSWPIDRGCLSTESLVLAGFFYTGSGSIIRCFHCGVEIEAWLDGVMLEPLEIHKMISNKCAFANGIPCGNITNQEISAGPSTKSLAINYHNYGCNNHVEFSRRLRGSCRKMEISRNIRIKGIDRNLNE